MDRRRRSWSWTRGAASTSGSARRCRQRYPKSTAKSSATDNLDTDPEVDSDLVGPLRRTDRPIAGHGTFIAGIVRQVCPDAEIVLHPRSPTAWADVVDAESQPSRSTRLWSSSSATPGHPRAAGTSSALNLSLGYYHETPEDDAVHRTLRGLLLDLRGGADAPSCARRATMRLIARRSPLPWRARRVQRRTLPPLAPLGRRAQPEPDVGGAVQQHRPVGATYARAPRCVTTFPAFNGGAAVGTRRRRHGRVRDRRSIRMTSPAASRVWSGTSFAAPPVAGAIAAALDTAAARTARTRSGHRDRAVANVRSAAVATLQGGGYGRYRTCRAAC